MAKIVSEFEQAFRSYMEIKRINSKSLTTYLWFYYKYVERFSDFNQQNTDAFLSSYPFNPARAMVKNLIKAIVRWKFDDEVKKEVSMIDIPVISGKEIQKESKFIRRSDLDILDLKIDLHDPIATERLKLMILVQFWAGLRVNELVNLSWNCFSKQNFVSTNDWQALKISAESAKFGKERIAYIETPLYLRVRAWGDKILRRRKLKSFDEPIWGLKTRAYSQQLADETLRILGEPYNTHSLRHGRGYDLRVREHKSIDFIKEYLGHSNIVSTQKYTHLGQSQIKEELEGFKKIEAIPIVEENEQISQ